MFDPDLQRTLREGGIVAVVILDRLHDAVPLARALLGGGVRALELTLRTSAAVEAIREIRHAVPEMIVGAGTVLTPQQVREVHDAGAAFAVAPGTNPDVIGAANALGLSFAPGVMTPSDIEIAVASGCRLLKFFPAESAGGPAMLRAIAAPYGHLGLRFIPLGGLNAENFAPYLSEPSVDAIGGSWLAPRELINSRSWPTITTRAAEAVRRIQTLRS